MSIYKGKTYCYRLNLRVRRCTIRLIQLQGDVLYVIQTYYSCGLWGVR